MNFKNIITEIEKTDPEVYERLSGRREALKNFGSKVALAALPFAIGSMFQKAYGKTTDAVVDALNLALEFEYMEYTYYRQGTNTTGLINPTDLAGFKSMEAQEKAHINFLNTTITALGGIPFKPNNFTAATTVAPYVPAAYDFTMGGVYQPFDDYKTFLLLAQVFEDTGLHAIQGQMQTFLSNNAVLTQAFQLQAAEARHAAFVRHIRRIAPISAPEEPAPWITNNIPPTIPFQSYYLSEDKVEYNGVIALNLPNPYYNNGQTPQVSATAAFDEGYDKTKILSLIKPFKK
ncbi:MAG: ferritin-like domain-containing protein [Flavipsychrobacter sp.]|nr:ferritin-like domain-containing protein [Flavipsychrobacter sp.]